MGHSSYTTRKAAFKQIDSAIKNLDTAMYHLLNVKRDYTEGHPEIAEASETLMQYILRIQQLTEAFRKSF